MNQELTVSPSLWDLLASVCSALGSPTGNTGARPGILTQVLMLSRREFYH